MKKFFFLLSLILSIVAFGQFPQPVLHLPLNTVFGTNNIASISGVGNGTANDAYQSTYDVCSGSSGSYWFDEGNNGNIVVNNNSKLAFNSAFTMCAWIVNYDTPREQEVFSKDQYNFGVNDNQIEIEMPNGTQNKFGTILDNVWTHIAVVRNGTSLRVFQNGIFVGSTTTGHNSISTNNLYLGKYNGNNTFNMDGQIQDARVYDVALTDQEIFTVFNSFAIVAKPLQTICGTGGFISVQPIHGAGHTFQWYKNGAILTGETSSSYFVTMPSLSDIYSVIGTSSCGNYTTNGISLVTISGIPTLSGISGSGTTRCNNTSTTITCSAVGQAMSYKWLKNGTEINAATDGGVFKNFTTPTLSITGFPASLVGTALDFTCSVSGLCDGVLSSIFTISVVGVPTFSGLSLGSSECIGNALTLSATGIYANTYRWRRSGIGSIFDGGSYANTTTETLSILTLPGIATSTVLGYSLRAFGACGTTTSSVINITVNGLTNISGPATNTDYCLGNTKTLAVTTNSGVGITYQWGLWDSGLTSFTGLSDNTFIAGVGTTNGVNSSNLTLSGLLSNISNKFIVTATGVCGSFESAVAGLNYQLNTTTTSPIDVVACQGANAVFSTTISGTGPFFYRWLRSDNNGPFNNFAGSTSVVNLTNVNPGNDDGDRFLVSVAGFCNTYTTTSALLTVQNNTSITTVISPFICQNSSGVVTVTAISVNPVYKWYKNSVAITSSTDGGIYGSSFTTSGLAISNAPLSINGASLFVTIQGQCGGMQTSTSVNLNIGSNAGASVNPPASFTTCLGSSISVNALGTGTGVNYQWQYFSGSWQNVINTGGLFSGATTNQLTINNLPASLDGTNFRLSVSGTCGLGNATQQATLDVNFGPNISVFGLKPKYCNYDDVDILQANSDLSLPFSAVEGFYTALSGGAGLSTSGMSFNRAAFRPFVYANTTPVAISYTSAPNALGCRNTTTLTSIVYSISGFGLQFRNLGNVFPNDQSSPEILELTATGGNIGTSSFFATFPGVTQSGVVGNLFYPSNVQPEPDFNNTTKELYIIGQFTEAISGCKDTITSKTTVFYPQTNYAFIETTTLNGFVNLPNKSTFCSTDYAIRTISFTGLIKPENTFLNLCRRSFSISISGIANTVIGSNLFNDASTGVNRYAMNNFTIIPGNLQSGTYSLQYFFDELSNAFTACNSARTAPQVFVQNTQQITIFTKPNQPGVTNFAVCEDLIDITQNLNFNGQNLEFYTTTSTSTIISSLTGKNNITLQELGFTTATGVGAYTFFTRQRVNGCPSDASAFTITIKPKPNKPTITTSLPATGACINQNMVSNYFTLNANSPLSTSYSWNILHTNALRFGDFSFFSTAIYDDNILPSAIPQVITVTAKSILNGCFSDSENKLITLNELPPLPSLSGLENGCMNFDNNFYKLPELEFSLNYNQPVNFFGDINFISQSTTLGFNTPTFTGTFSRATTNNYLISTTTGIIEVKNIYVTNTITGCRSINGPNESARIFQRPARPIAGNTDIFCNTSNYGIIFSSSFTTKWYSEPNATTTGLATGRFFNVSSAMPPNRYLKDEPVDTIFYATQIISGCESSTTGVRFRMFEPFKPLPISSTPLTVPYINLQFGTEPCEGNAGYAWINNYVSSIAFTHPLGGTKDLIIKQVSTSLGSNSFENPNKIAYEMGSFAFGQNPTFEIQEFFKTPLNKICYSAPALTTWQLTQKPKPNPPVLRDTAYCIPGTVGNIIAISTVSGGFIPAFRWSQSISGVASVFSSTDFIPKVTVSGSTLTGLHNSTFSASLSGQNVLPAQNIDSDTTIYQFSVSQIVDGCFSEVSSVQKMKLYHTPEAPSSSKKQEFCVGQTILPLNIVTNSSTLNLQTDWFSTTSLGSMVASNVTSYLPPVSSILGWTSTATSFVDYVGYATSLEYIRNYPKLNFPGCRSSFASDTIRLKAIPPTPISTRLVKYCLQKGAFSDPLSATGLFGLNSNFTWSDLDNPSNSDVNTPQFNPNIPLLSPVTRKFAVLQNFDGCQSLGLVVTVSVYELPISTFTGLNNSYCDGAVLSTLIGLNTNNLISKFYTISDLTSTLSGSSYLTTFGGASSHIATFDVRNPVATIDKLFEITYNVVDSNSCKNEKSQKVEVFAKQLFTFQALDGGVPKTVFCSNDNRALLTEPAPSGSFSSIPASAVVGNDFIPNAVGVITNSSVVDTVKVTYNYFDKNNCPSSVENKFVVKPSPIVSFKMSSHCVGISSFTGITSIVGKNGDGLNYHTWFINNDSISNQPNFNFDFIASGLYNIEYKVKSDLGCSDEFVADSTIDAYPVVNFDWKNICSGDITQFTNKSFIPVGGGLLKDVSWKFDSNPNLILSSLTINPSFGFGQANAYPVTLKVSTQENCVTSLTSVVNILPVATISGLNSYTENFDTGTGNWFANGQNSSWIWGQNASTNTGTNTSPQWAMNQNNGNYNQNERSYLYGPCLDIRGLNRPMIRMDMKYNTANANNDGMVLQFAIDSDTVWQPVGNQGTGINWYRSRNIVNNPGEQVQFLTNILNNPQTATSTGAYFRQMGWNGNSQDWITVRNTLDEAKKQSQTQNAKIRLRLAFSTSGNVVADGFSIDNVVVSSRSKKTLLENFANINSSESNTAQNQTLDNFFTLNKEDVVGINYHTGFPATDVFNSFNPSDPSTRVLFYGVETVPRAAVNGDLVFGSSTNIGLNFLLDQTLLDPAFEIRAAFSNQNNLFAVTAQFVANDNMTLSNATPKEYIAHVAVIEKTISSVPNVSLSKAYRNVLKRMLPNPAGTSLIDTWNAGTSKTIYQSWAYGNGDLYNKDSLAAVIFIQDKETKKVLQAQLVGVGVPQTALPTLIQDNNINAEVGQFIVYPNPSASVFNIIYTLSDAKNWELYDVTGRLLQTGKFDNTSKSEIDASALSNGIYHLKIGASIKKLVVSH